MAAPTPAIADHVAWPPVQYRAPVRTGAAPAEPLSHVPTATYRIQFGPHFGFSEARRLVPFLNRLGVSHIYASPIFAARSGSSHGYDVIDPLRLNPQLGTAEEFDGLTEDLKRRRMGLILDIVPNHMAASAENRWWEDVLEDGPDSAFARYFDIEWNALPDGLKNRIILPVLGSPYGQTLENGELQLGIDERGFFVSYWEHRFPLSLRSYSAVLGFGCPPGEALPAATEAPPGSMRGLVAAIERLPSGPAAARPRYAGKNAVKQRLWELYRNIDEVRRFVDWNLRACNGTKTESTSFRLLDRLLSDQSYILSYWRTGREQVNYRRFFDVNELVGVRVEDEEVFGESHALILRLAREGKIAGVRIDHLDGLHNPRGYLRRLEACLTAPEMPRRMYVVAEKITLGKEVLDRNWPVCGTTGYDFLNVANAVFVDAGNLRHLENTYSRFTGIRAGFDELVYQQKKRVIGELFGAELRRLTVELQALASQDRHAREAQPEELAAALVELTACLPVYRTYISSYDVSRSDRKWIEHASEVASARGSTVSGPILDFLRRVLLLELPEDAADARRAAWLAFVMRWQQFSGPVMAKGMEDTACYVYNRLVSLNVVGGVSRPVTVEEFHTFNAERARSSPLGLNATSTHDTKRSEDVSARINVLSELPELWNACLERWSRWNCSNKRLAHGVMAPSANDEVLLYQVMLGAWPLDEDEVPDFKERLRNFVIKAAREAKIHTNWLAPEVDYEQALLGFVDAILDPDAGNIFLRDFLRVQAMLAPFGSIGSLAQAVLKITCPGVPDFYQGTLLWDFSLVDPDNRRPIDFARRIRLFGAVTPENGQSRLPLLEDVLENWRDGRLKLYVVSRALEHRRAHRALFLAGDYIPLDVSGPAAEHVIAFARRVNGEWAVVAVPRLLAALCRGRDPASNPGIWTGTEIHLPPDAPGGWRNVFTGELVRGRPLAASRLFGQFPVAVLSAGE
jgi:(1->4)-alpha-D-glucan 1-alpha-D-glucosylmutase